MSDYTPPFPWDKCWCAVRALGYTTKGQTDEIIGAVQPIAEDARAPLLARIAELEANAKLLAWIEKHARQNTAHDRYGDGGYWTIGFFSPDNRLSFRKAVDTAMKGNGDA
jgi:hypothetical protein